MKRIVLVFGLIAGAILSAMMLVTIPFHDQLAYNTALAIGYTTMIVAFLMVFFGIRSYREGVGNGSITFGRGFKVGLLITLIASACYVLTWETIYFVIAPDYAEKMASEAIAEHRASGKSGPELDAELAKIERFQALYRNPLFNAGMTLLEVLPVGLIMTAVSAAILRRRGAGGSAATVGAPA